MSYADFAYYSEVYGGSLIPQDKFSSLAEKASDRIDAATFGRLENGVPEEYEKNVKRCCCELAENIYNYSALSDGSSIAGAGSVASENIGKYSVTYRSGTEQISTISAQLHGENSGLEDIYKNIIMRHLGRTGLLFRGI